MKKDSLTSSTPFKIAIIGAGPSGFYATDALFKSELPVHIDLFEKCPLPYGLLRYGVAPDHQQMKTVSKYFERMVQKNYDHFRYFGNVDLSAEIDLQSLSHYYHAVIVTVGSQSDRRLAIPGADLKQVFTATEFVGWYNGHPDFQSKSFNLQGSTAVIIGLGNVALDVARLLGKTPEELAKTDIPESVLLQLSLNQIKDIHLFGRRSPLEAAFTHHELKEFLDLEDCYFKLSPEDINLSAKEEELLQTPAYSQARKNMNVLRELSQRDRGEKSKTIHLNFLSSPHSFEGDNVVKRMVVTQNKLQDNQKSRVFASTDQQKIYNCDIVFQSIGYRGVGVSTVPFDESRGVISNQSGRVLNEDGSHLKSFYTSGWIKRGPTGVIGTNKTDSQETVSKLIEDLETRTAIPLKTEEELFSKLNLKQSLSFEDWQKIDAEELRKGAELNKPREKMVNTQAILEFLGKV